MDVVTRKPRRTRNVLPLAANLFARSRPWPTTTDRWKGKARRRRRRDEDEMYRFFYMLPDELQRMALQWLPIRVFVELSVAKEPTALRLMERYSHSFFKQSVDAKYPWAERLFAPFGEVVACLDARNVPADERDEEVAEKQLKLMGNLIEAIYAILEVRTGRLLHFVPCWIHTMGRMPYGYLEFLEYVDDEIRWAMETLGFGPFDAVMLRWRLSWKKIKGIGLLAKLLQGKPPNDLSTSSTVVAGGLLRQMALDGLRLYDHETQRLNGIVAGVLLESSEPMAMDVYHQVVAEEPLKVQKHFCILLHRLGKAYSHKWSLRLYSDDDEDVWLPGYQLDDEDIESIRLTQPDETSPAFWDIRNVRWCKYRTKDVYIRTKAFFLQTKFSYLLEAAAKSLVKVGLQNLDDLPVSDNSLIALRQIEEAVIRESVEAGTPIMFGESIVHGDGVIDSTLENLANTGKNAAPPTSMDRADQADHTEADARFPNTAAPTSRPTPTDDIALWSTGGAIESLERLCVWMNWLRNSRERPRPTSPDILSEVLRKEAGRTAPATPRFLRRTKSAPCVVFRNHPDTEDAKDLENPSTCRRSRKRRAGRA